MILQFAGIYRVFRSHETKCRTPSAGLVFRPIVAIEAKLFLLSDRRPLMLRNHRNQHGRCSNITLHISAEKTVSLTVLCGYVLWSTCMSSLCRSCQDLLNFWEAPVSLGGGNMSIRFTVETIVIYVLWTRTSSINIARQRWA
jgi:hypothetical protein